MGQMLGRCNCGRDQLVLILSKLWADRLNNLQRLKRLVHFQLKHQRTAKVSCGQPVKETAKLQITLTKRFMIFAVTAHTFRHFL